jgi:hypothetical protein
MLNQLFVNFCAFLWPNKSAKSQFCGIAEILSIGG